MTLVPVNYREIPGGLHYASTKYQVIVDSFIASSLDAAMLEGIEPNKAGNVSTSIRSYIKQHRVSGVTAISRQGRVYLIRTDRKLDK